MLARTTSQKYKSHAATVEFETQAMMRCKPLSALRILTNTGLPLVVTD
jgi:hypothetical protein